MKQELEEKLFSICPAWFNREDVKSSLMCFGFEVEDGWYNVLHTALSELHVVLLEAGELRSFEIAQVKEKFGTMRLYWHLAWEDYTELPPGIMDKIETIVYKAEVASALTCEICGAPGGPTGKRWIKTTCKKHARKI